jgi:hypothetical protein
MARILYHVVDEVTNVDYLVEASSRAQAIGHLARGQFTARPASALLAMDLAERGVKRQRAGDEQLDLGDDDPKANTSEPQA